MNDGAKDALVGLIIGAVTVNMSIATLIFWVWVARRLFP